MLDSGMAHEEREAALRSLNLWRGERNLNLKRVAGLVALIVVTVACGDDPLSVFGERSSDWINEPEVITTTTIPVTVPVVVGVERLLWSNDEIISENLADPELLVSEVFARREGDRFIQASRAEIATMLPDVKFPAQVPSSAEWVSSQLVIDNSGRLSDDPSAAFGIWSAEPYTRSRSVAQIAVLRVSTDADTAIEVASATDEPSCARFADQTTISCEILDLSDRSVWSLVSNQGTTLVWFDTIYRYELYGRTFLNFEAMTGMVSEIVPLSDLIPSAS